MNERINSGRCRLGKVDACDWQQFRVGAWKFPAELQRFQICRQFCIRVNVCVYAPQLSRFHILASKFTLPSSWFLSLLPSFRCCRRLPLPLAFSAFASVFRNDLDNFLFNFSFLYNTYDLCDPLHEKPMIDVAWRFCSCRFRRCCRRCRCYRYRRFKDLPWGRDVEKSLGKRNPVWLISFKVSRKKANYVILM